LSVAGENRSSETESLHAEAHGLDGRSLSSLNLPEHPNGDMKRDPQNRGNGSSKH